MLLKTGIAEYAFLIGYEFVCESNYKKMVGIKCYERIKLFL